MNETEFQKLVQFECSRRGQRLWRNNIGATYDQTGRFIRYGLANESVAVNKNIKSGDLIGITPRIITPADVGHTVGIFTSVEVKRPGWSFKATSREQAQQRWIDLINSLGGYAKFVSDLNEL